MLIVSRGIIELSLPRVAPLMHVSTPLVRRAHGTPVVHTLCALGTRGTPTPSLRWFGVQYAILRAHWIIRPFRLHFCCVLSRVTLLNITKQVNK